jgi:hypothetical protein
VFYTSQVALSNEITLHSNRIVCVLRSVIVTSSLQQQNELLSSRGAHLEKETAAQLSTDYITSRFLYLSHHWSLF